MLRYYSLTVTLNCVIKVFIKHLEKCIPELYYAQSNWFRLILDVHIVKQKNFTFMNFAAQL